MTCCSPGTIDPGAGGTLIVDPAVFTIRNGSFGVGPDFIGEKKLEKILQNGVNFVRQRRQSDRHAGSGGQRAAGRRRQPEPDGRQCRRLQGHQRQDRHRLRQYHDDRRGRRHRRHRRRRPYRGADQRCPRAWIMPAISCSPRRWAAISASRTLPSTRADRAATAACSWPMPAAKFDAANPIDVEAVAKGTGAQTANAQIDITAHDTLDAPRPQGFRLGLGAGWRRQSGGARRRGSDRAGRQRSGQRLGAGGHGRPFRLCASTPLPI